MTNLTFLIEIVDSSQFTMYQFRNGLVATCRPYITVLFQHPRHWTVSITVAYTLALYDWKCHEMCRRLRLNFQAISSMWWLWPIMEVVYCVFVSSFNNAIHISDYSGGGGSALAAFVFLLESTVFKRWFFALEAMQKAYSVRGQLDVQACPVWSTCMPLHAENGILGGWIPAAA